MGALSSASGVSLVVPGYFVCAGILLFAAIVAAVLGFFRGRVPLYLAYAATCIFSAAVAVATASYYLADSVGGAIEALRWQASAAILLVVAITVFVALYTNSLRSQRAMLMVTFVAGGVLLLANAVLPNGLRFDAIEYSGWLHFSWGESLFYVKGTPGPWNAAYRFLALALVAWGVWRLLLQYRQGAQREAVFLAAYLLVLAAASIHGAMIDLGWVKSFHSIGFALVGLALLMGLNLILGLREQNLQLAQTAMDLLRENELRRDAETRTLERALRDELTGLPNRIAAEERLAALSGDGAARAFGGLLLCNLDHFKVVNDALSHTVGDALLRQAALRLGEAAGGRALVARMGGDEFLAVSETMFPTEEEAAQRVRILAEDMSAALARPFMVGEQPLNLLASIGTATFASGEGPPADIVRRADMALHQAKKRGRNTIEVYSPELQRKAESKYRIVEGLRRAISAGELALHFQPQLDDNGSCVGAEALLRWRSPDMGAVLPSTFIPIAEETGLIHPLGEWSLRRGCERLAAWRREGARFKGRLSINVSPWQLARPDFVASLRDIIESTRVDPRQLTLEITESAMLYDVGETVAKLRDIRPLGVRIALDDFGTGYSSLALIKDLPLDAIKIDQAFVRHLHEGANQHLVRVVVAIGNELDLDVIAEGVETAADRDTLLALGCRKMQGFLFSRPLAEPEFLAWVAARTAPERLAKNVSI
jgi:diguanylate cyclase